MITFGLPVLHSTLEAESKQYLKDFDINSFPIHKPFQPGKMKMAPV